MLVLLSGFMGLGKLFDVFYHFEDGGEYSVKRSLLLIVHEVIILFYDLLPFVQKLGVHRKFFVILQSVHSFTQFLEFIKKFLIFSNLVP
jgi:hypothetical protein